MYRSRGSLQVSEYFDEKHLPRGRYHFESPSARSCHDLTLLAEDLWDELNWTGNATFEPAQPPPVRLYSDQVPEEQVFFSAGSHTEYKM